MYQENEQDKNNNKDIHHIHRERRAKESQKERKTDLLHQRAVPFESAQEAWFWFILAQDAKNDGARITAGQALVPRPCEPADILQTLDRLYRNRLLKWDHCLVLRHYGRKQMAPDTRYVKEQKADKLWKEAMARLEPALIRKNIVRDDDLDKETNFSSTQWTHDANIFQANRQQDVLDGRV